MNVCLQKKPPIYKQELQAVIVVTLTADVTGHFELLMDVIDLSELLSSAQAMNLHKPVIGTACFGELHHHVAEFSFFTVNDTEGCIRDMASTL